MFMQALYQLSQTMQLSTKKGLTFKNVPTIILIKNDKFDGVQSLLNGTEKVRMLPCPDFSTPEMVKNGFRQPFIDTVDTITGQDLKKFAKYCKVLELAAGAGVSVAKTLLDFLRQEDNRAQLIIEFEKEKIKPISNVTFIIDGQLINNDTSWHNWFFALKNSFEVKSNEMERSCITGNLVTPVRVCDQVKIKGLPNGHSIGCVLTSFDKPAFTSYGLERGLNYPMSEDEAMQIAATANQLIKDGSYINCGNVFMLYWYTNQTKETQFDILGEIAPMLEYQKTEEDLRQLIEKRNNIKRMWSDIKNGKIARPDNVTYHIMFIRGNDARTRFVGMHEGTLTSLIENCNTWIEQTNFNNQGASINRMLWLLYSKSPEQCKLWLWNSLIFNQPIQETIGRRAFAALCRELSSVNCNSSNVNAILGLLQAYLTRKGKDMNGRGWEFSLGQIVRITRCAQQLCYPQKSATFDTEIRAQNTVAYILKRSQELFNCYYKRLNQKSSATMRKFVTYREELFKDFNDVSITKKMTDEQFVKFTIGVITRCPFEEKKED